MAAGQQALTFPQLAGTYGLDKPITNRYLFPFAGN
jgi:hypothetical protein